MAFSFSAVILAFFVPDFIAVSSMTLYDINIAGHCSDYTVDLLWKDQNTSFLLVILHDVVTEGKKKIICIQGFCAQPQKVCRH